MITKKTRSESYQLLTTRNQPDSIFKYVYKKFQFIENANTIWINNAD